jgi:hypothetical protein
VQQVFGLSRSGISTKLRPRTERSGKPITMPLRLERTGSIYIASNPYSASYPFGKGSVCQCCAATS